MCCHSYKPYTTVFTRIFIVYQTNHEGKSCVSIVRYNFYLAKEYHKERIWIMWLVFVDYFSIQTVATSGYYGIESFTLDTELKTRLFLVAWVLNNSVVLSSLVICAEAHY